MNFKKLFGYGALIWALTYLAIVITIVAGAARGLLFLVVLVSVPVIAAFLFGRKLAVGSRLETLKYSAGWAIISLILDSVFIVSSVGWRIYFILIVLLSCVLIFLAPMFAVKKK